MKPSLRISTCENARRNPRRNPGQDIPAVEEHPDLTYRSPPSSRRVDHQADEKMAGYRRRRRLRRQRRTAELRRRLDRPLRRPCRRREHLLHCDAETDRQALAAFRASNPKNPIVVARRTRWKNPPSACCARVVASTTCMPDWCDKGGARSNGQSCWPGPSVCCPADIAARNPEEWLTAMATARIPPG